jgi:L-threonylcarbamoyladenylate synthase
VIVAVEQAARCVRAGGVVAYPTETVYGLGANATLPDAVARVRALKGRDDGRGLSVLVQDLDDAERFLGELPPLARRLGLRFWPGPLTLVVPARAARLASVATEHGVGLRCSSHPTAAALVRAAGCPILSTSCNRTGQPPCTCAEDVERAFGPALPVAGGERAGGAPPSTVVAVTQGGELRVLREGAVARARLLEAAQEGCR